MKRKLNVFSILFLLSITVFLTSCGPQRAEVTFHVDEDVYIKTIIIAETTSSITINVFEENRNLKVQKGDIVTYSVPKGHYDFYIYVDKQLSPNYKFPSNYDYLRPYFCLACETTGKSSLDIYFSDVYYGNGYSIKK